MRALTGRNSGRHQGGSSRSSILSGRASRGGNPVGLDSPSPCFDVSREPKIDLLRSTVIELFSVCITSRMITRSDQRRGISSRAADGRLTRVRTNCVHRCRRVPPSVMIVFNSPIALLPLP